MILCEHRLPVKIPTGAVATSICLGFSLALCAPIAAADTHQVSVVATTPILGDFVRNVGGDHVAVTTLLNSDAEALSYDPTLRDMAQISTADVVLTNHLNLEPEPLMHALDSALAPNAELIRVAENIPTYHGELIPLVENAALDTAWLGFSVEESTHPVTVRMTQSSGPGDVTAFITGALGEPRPVLQVPGDASLNLEAGSHTHLNWAFTAPGDYRVELHATSPSGALDKRCSLRFVVGTHPGRSQGTAIDHGHWDITVTNPAGSADKGVATEELVMTGEDSTGEDSTLSCDQATVTVPPATLVELPKDKHFDFLRESRSQKDSKKHNEVYLLAQAVIGRHRHGEVDPHVWLNPHNAKAAATVIANALSRADPAHSQDYAHNALEYQDRIEATTEEVRTFLNQIPPERRYLISDYDALRYFAQFYDLTVAGFMGRHPQDQPSTRQLITVSRAISSLALPAVFLDAATSGAGPSLATSGAGSADLRAIASDQDVGACSLYLSSFNPSAGVTDYLSLLRTTARTLSDCLTQGATR